MRDTIYLAIEGFTPRNQTTCPTGGRAAPRFKLARYGTIGPQGSAIAVSLGGHVRLKQLAIVTHETIGARMAGPAIRALELARAMRPEVEPIIVSPRAVERDTDGIEARQYRPGEPESMARALAGADVLLVQGFTLHHFPGLVADPRPMVVDLYCPFHLENLERRRLVETDAAARLLGAQVDLDVLLVQLSRGDFFICASERQRDYWLGMLSAAGRLSPSTYEADPSASNMVAVVPFGIEAVPPSPGPPLVKGVRPGIGEGDRLVVWGGAVTDWQDPCTAIEAVCEAAQQIERLRLVFPATIPNPDLPPMKALEKARKRARELGLLDRNVFFIDWVAYDERGRFLLEAEAGISAHSPSLEARYSWRTRMLDYIWASLPIVCTRGDDLSALVESRGLGVAVDPGDHAGMARALARVLGDGPFREECIRRIRAEQPHLVWRRVAEPLRRFAAAPWKAGAGLEAALAAPAPARHRGLRRAARAIVRRLNR
ncbi:MAG: glycosyltransferase family 4 protein [Vicinamibacterales bacterium]